MSEERDDDGRDSGGVVRDGAAADGAEAEGEVGALPRLLRLAHHAIGGHAKPRVVAELAELLPEETAAAAAWSDNHQNRGWQPLATRLDGAAVRLDRPALRSLADAVRLSSMTVGEVRAHPAEALRVIAALDAALREADIKPTIATRLLALGEQMVIGWSALAGGDRGRFIDAGTHAHRHAYELGRAATHHVRIHEADKVSEREQHGRRAADAKAKEQTADAAHLRVSLCRCRDRHPAGAARRPRHRALPAGVPRRRARRRQEPVGAPPQ